MYKNQVIKHEGKYYKCICIDDEYAVFVKSNRKGTKLKFNKMFAVSVIIGFDYEEVD